MDYFRKFASRHKFRESAKQKNVVRIKWQLHYRVRSHSHVTAVSFIVLCNKIRLKVGKSSSRPEVRLQQLPTQPRSL